MLGLETKNRKEKSDSWKSLYAVQLPLNALEPH